MSLTTIIWIIAIILVVGVAFYLIKSPSEPPMSPPEGPPAM